MTPPELSKTLVAVFRFEDVRLVEWRKDQVGHDWVTAHPDAPPGQIELFDGDSAGLFTLHTFTLCLAFHALTVRAE